MKKALFILLLLPIFCFSQNDTINQYVNGKKNGVWKVYLDSLLNPVKDESSAFFIAYEAYDFGDRIFKCYKRDEVGADSLFYNNEWPIKGNPQVLDGFFEWKTNDGRILAQEEYKNGWPWYWKLIQYYKKYPQKIGMIEILDWSKKYNGIFGTYYYEDYFDTELHCHGWFRKGKKGWRVYKEKK